MQPFLAAAEVARDNGKAHRLGKVFKIFLGIESKRAKHQNITFIIQEFRRHGGKTPAVKQVHEEGFKDVFPVMAEHQSRTALFTGDPVKMAAAKP